MANITSKVHGSAADINSNEWNNLVKQSSLGSVFQRTPWLKVIEESLNTRPTHVEIREEGNLIAICPNFIDQVRLPDVGDIKAVRYLRECASVPIGFGGPIAQRNEEIALKTIVDTIDDQCSLNVISSFFKIVDPNYLRYAQFFRSIGYVPNLSNGRFVLNLSKGSDRIVKEMGKDRRYNLRKAKENNPRTCVQELNSDGIGRFYSTYKKAMGRQGTSPLPRSFLEALVEHMKERTLLITAYVDGEQIGQHLYIKDREQSSLHHFLSAVAKKNFDYFPSEIIHERAINWAIDNGYQKYDMGGTGADYTDGVFKYKEQFGGNIEPTIIWERKQSPLWRGYKFARRVYRRD